MPLHSRHAAQPRLPRLHSPTHNTVITTTILFLLLLLVCVPLCSAIRIPLPFQGFSLTTNTSLLVSYTTVQTTGAVLNSVSDLCALPEEDEVEAGGDVVAVTAGPCTFVSNTLTTNAPFEQYVIIAALLMNTSRRLPFTLDEAVPLAYLPPLFSLQGGLYNPSYPSVPITLRMLMRHVSSFAAVATPSSSSSQSSSLYSTSPSVRNNNNNRKEEGEGDGTLRRTNERRGAQYTADGDVSVWDSYLSNLLLATGPAFYTRCSPGPGACYNHSFANVAMLAAVLQRVLTEQYNRHDSAAASGDLLAYISANIFAPLAMTRTSFTSVTVNGFGETTMQDQLTLLQSLFFPTGLWYKEHHALSVAMTQPILRYDAAQPTRSPFIPFASGIAQGWLVTSYDTLCESARLGSVPELLSCTLLLRKGDGEMKNTSSEASSTTTSSSSSSQGEKKDEDDEQPSLLYVQVLDDNEVQFVWLCDLPSLAPDTDTTRSQPDRLQAGTSTSTSSSSSSSTSSAMLRQSSSSTQPFVPPSVQPSRCALHVFRTNTEPAPTPIPTITPAPSPPNNNTTISGGVYIFVGVLAAVLASLIGSYAADYFIHPVPPPKIMLPVAEMMTTMNNNNNNNNNNSYGVGLPMRPHTRMSDDGRDSTDTGINQDNNNNNIMNLTDDLVATYSTRSEDEDDVRRRKEGAGLGTSRSFPATFISSVVPPPQAMAAMTSGTWSNKHNYYDNSAAAAAMSIVPPSMRRQPANNNNITGSADGQFVPRVTSDGAARPLFIVPPQAQAQAPAAVTGATSVDEQGQRGQTTVEQQQQQQQQQQQPPRLDLYT